MPNPMQQQQGQPAAGAPHPGQGADQSQSSGKVVELFKNVNDGLTLIVDLALKSGMPDDAVKELQDIKSRYTQVLSQVMGGSAEGETAPTEAKTAPSSGNMMQGGHSQSSSPESMQRMR
jgi:hypothetical protein